MAIINERANKQIERQIDARQTPRDLNGPLFTEIRNGDGTDSLYEMVLPIGGDVASTNEEDPWSSAEPEFQMIFLTGTASARDWFVYEDGGPRMTVYCHACEVMRVTDSGGRCVAEPRIYPARSKSGTGPSPYRFLGERHRR